MAIKYYYAGQEYDTESDAQSAVDTVKLRLENNPTDWMKAKEMEFVSFLIPEAKAVSPHIRPFRMQCEHLPIVMDERMGDGVCCVSKSCKSLRKGDRGYISSYSPVTDAMQQEQQTPSLVHSISCLAFVLRLNKNNIR